MVAVAIGGAALIGGATSIISGNKAANAAKDAASQTDATNRYIYDTTRADYAPWRQVGTNALGKLAKLYGVDSGMSNGMGSAFIPGYSGGYSPTNGIYDFGGTGEFQGINYGNLGQYFSGYQAQPTPQAATAQTDSTDRFADFYDSPDYQFRLSEGLKAIERSAAARGSLRSGATMKAMNRYAQDTASGEYGNYVNRLAALAGIGQSATGSTAQAGQNYASASAANNANAGNARASAYANTGNAINSTVQNLTSAYLYGKGYGGFG